MGEVEIDAETKATVDEIAARTGDSDKGVVRRAVREVAELDDDEKDDDDKDDDEEDDDVKDDDVKDDDAARRGAE